MDYAKAGGFFFHYTTADIAFGHILPTGLVRLTPYSQMRDPLEAKAWHVPAGYRGEEDSQDRRLWEEALGRLHQATKEQSKLLSLSVDLDPPGGAGRLALFGRGYARASMWELYADRHAGVCLLFDRQRLVEVLEEGLTRLGKSFHGPVQYDVGGLATAVGASTFLMPDPGEPLVAAIARHVDRHREALFFTKLADWEHEAEYRFVVVTDDDVPVLCSYGDALRGVMVGHAFPKWQIPSAHAACEAAGVELGKLLWEMNRPLTIRLPRDNAGGTDGAP